MSQPVATDGPVLTTTPSDISGGGVPGRETAADLKFDPRPRKALAGGPWQATPVVSGTGRESSAATQNVTSATVASTQSSPADGSSSITENYAVGLPVLEVSEDLSPEVRTNRRSLAGHRLIFSSDVCCAGPELTTLEPHRNAKLVWKASSRLTKRS